MRIIYAIAGALIGACISIAANLLSAAIQKRAFTNSFSNMDITWLIGVIVIGLLAGLWLGAPLTLQPRDQASQQAPPLKITRLRALLSYAKLRGQGIALTDIVIVGSVIDIDTRE